VPDFIHKAACGSPFAFPRSYGTQGGFRNFCGRLQLRVADQEARQASKVRPTPAMMAGLTDNLWDFEELFHAVERQLLFRSDDN
jgi:hypothetical protein